MSRITDCIHARNRNGQIALVGFLPVGFPSIGQFRELVKISVENGVDVVELGIPLADPFLDGKIIRDAYTSVIQTGLTTDQLVEIGGEALTASGGTGLALVYAETVEAYGRQTFLQKLADTGYHGLLVPNANREQISAYQALALDCGLEIVVFAPAGGDSADLIQMLDHSGGFIYMQGVAGSTGQQIKVDQDLITRYQNLKNAAQPVDLPVLIGFGIRQAEDVGSLCKMRADGVIIGTAFVEAAAKPLDQFRQYVRSLSRATFHQE